MVKLISYNNTRIGMQIHLNSMVLILPEPMDLPNILHSMHGNIQFYGKSKSFLFGVDTIYIIWIIIFS